MLLLRWRVFPDEPVRNWTETVAPPGSRTSRICTDHVHTVESTSAPVFPGIVRGCLSMIAYLVMVMRSMMAGIIATPVFGAAG